MRRCTAVVGIFALVLAFSPGVVCVLNAGQAPSCCAGTMCPMHTSGGHMTCGMDMAHGSAFQACGCHSAQYTGGLVFNLVVPPGVGSERVTRAALVLLEVASANVRPEVVSPPPRLTLG